MESANHHYLWFWLPRLCGLHPAALLLFEGQCFLRRIRIRQEKKIDEARRKIAENFKRQLPPSTMVFVLVMVASSFVALSPMAARGSTSISRSSRRFIAISRVWGKCDFFFRVSCVVLFSDPRKLAQVVPLFQLVSRDLTHRCTCVLSTSWPT